MHMTKTILLAALLGFVFTPLSFAQGRVGYLNLNSVLEGTEEGKAIVGKLQTEFAAKKVELQKRMKAFEEKFKQFQRQAQMLKDDVRQERAKALAAEEQQLQGLLMQYQAEIDKKKGMALSQFEKKLRGVIEQVAKKEGLDYVVRHEVLLYGPAKMDLTNQIIRVYDQRYASKKGGAKKGK